MKAWLLAFVFTQLIEAPIYRFGAKSTWRTALLASTVTHPFVWFAFPLLQDVGVEYWPMVACAEAFAVCVEAGWLRFHHVPRAFAWSLAANATSVAIGLALREWLGFP